MKEIKFTTLSVFLILFTSYNNIRAERLGLAKSSSTGQQYEGSKNARCE